MRLNKTLLLTFLVLLIVSISGYAVFNVFKDSPTKTVKKYWELAFEGNVKEAAELKSDTSYTSPMDDSDGRALAGNIKNSDGTTEDCCYGKEIAERKLKINKIIEFNQEKQNALVAVETEDKDQKNEIYVNCLSRRGGKWIITGISPDIYEDRNALCFPTDKPLKPKRF